LVKKLADLLYCTYFLPVAPRELANSGLFARKAQSLFDITLHLRFTSINLSQRMKGIGSAYSEIKKAGAFHQEVNQTSKLRVQGTSEGTPARHNLGT